MVFGTFDGLHPGHLDFFKQAAKWGDYLIIVVARDINVKKIKGHLPKFRERKRLNEVKKAIPSTSLGTGKKNSDIAIKRYSDKAILGGLKDPMAVIRKHKPDVICLGYDQRGFTKGLKEKFSKIKIVRLKPYRQHIYKSSKIKIEKR